VLDDGIAELGSERVESEMGEYADTDLRVSSRDTEHWGNTRRLAVQDDDRKRCGEGRGANETDPEGTDEDSAESVGERSETTETSGEPVRRPRDDNGGGSVCVRGRVCERAWPCALVYDGGVAKADGPDRPDDADNDDGRLCRRNEVSLWGGINIAEIGAMSVSEILAANVGVGGSVARCLFFGGR